MKPRIFFYLLVGLTTAIAVGGGAGCYYLSKTVSQKSLVLKQKLADQQVAEARITQLNILKHQYDRIQGLIAAVNEALPPAKKQSEIVLQLEKLAANSGLSLPGVVFSGGSGSQLPSPTTMTAAKGDVLVMPMQLHMNGSYEQMVAFLRSLETLGRYANVTNIDITNNKPKNLTFSLTLNAYLKP